jgi:hypothetical protein
VIFDEATARGCRGAFGVSTHKLAELMRDARLALAGLPLWTGHAPT